MLLDSFLVVCIAEGHALAVTVDVRVAVLCKVKSLLVTYGKLALSVIFGWFLEYSQGGCRFFSFCLVFLHRRLVLLIRLLILLDIETFMESMTVIPLVIILFFISLIIIIIQQQIILHQ